MTVQEIMERSGMKNTTLTIAWIKDAIHLLQSNSKEKVKSKKSFLGCFAFSYQQ